MIAFTFGSARGIGSRAAAWLAAKSLLRSNMESRMVIFAALHRNRFSEGILGLTIFGSQENRGQRECSSFFYRWKSMNVPPVHQILVECFGSSGSVVWKAASLPHSIAQNAIELSVRLCGQPATFFYATGKVLAFATVLCPYLVMRLLTKSGSKPPAYAISPAREPRLFVSSTSTS